MSEPAFLTLVALIVAGTISFLLVGFSALWHFISINRRPEDDQ